MSARGMAAKAKLFLRCFLQKNQAVETILKKHEKEKKKAYNSCIVNVEYRTFTPIVFSLTGGKSPEASMFLKHKM